MVACFVVSAAVWCIYMCVCVCVCVCVSTGVKCVAPCHSALRMCVCASVRMCVCSLLLLDDVVWCGVVLWCEMWCGVGVVWGAVWCGVVLLRCCPVLLLLLHSLAGAMRCGVVLCCYGCRLVRSLSHFPHAAGLSCLRYGTL